MYAQQSRRRYACPNSTAVPKNENFVVWPSGETDAGGLAVERKDCLVPIEFDYSQGSCSIKHVHSITTGTSSVVLFFMHTRYTMHQPQQISLPLH